MEKRQSGQDKSIQIDRIDRVPRTNHPAAKDSHAEVGGVLFLSICQLPDVLHALSYTTSKFFLGDSNFNTTTGVWQQHAVFALY